MDLAIVTGMSGAGKTVAINALEDIGYYCVDNVPPQFVAKFAGLPLHSGGKNAKTALVVDVRSHELFEDYAACLNALKNAEIPFKMLFLDCDDEALMRRYKETRRRHPLLQDGVDALKTALRTERDMLSTAKPHADFILDTSNRSPAETKSEVKRMFGYGARRAMQVSIYSFGFKHSYPTDADLLFDVRCLPNPHYIDSLKNKTGLDDAVQEYVLSSQEAQGLVTKLIELIEYLLPLYEKEGKSRLVIAIGCTGGKHRSVTFAQLMGKYLEDSGSCVHIAHRDIEV